MNFSTKRHISNDNSLLSRMILSACARRQPQKIAVAVAAFFVAVMVMGTILTGTARSKEIFWGDFIIPVTGAWTVEPQDDDDPDGLVLTISDGAAVGMLKIDKEQLPEITAAQYDIWLTRFEKRWVQSGFQNAEFFRAGGPTVLGIENCPYGVGEKNGKRLYQFVPMKNNRVRLIMAAVHAAGSTKMPPEFILKMVAGITMAGEAAPVEEVAVAAVPADIPPVLPARPAPFMDIKTLTQRQWDGTVSAAMEGMRMVYGPMSTQEDETFRKTWGALRHQPTDEAVDYLNKFNPLLGEFLSLRGAVADTAALLEQAVTHAGWAAQIDDAAQAMQYTALAGQYRNMLLSRQKRLDTVIDKLIALGNPPDGAELMAQGQSRYGSAKRYLNSLLAPSDPEGEWLGYIYYPKGLPFLKDKGIKHEPIHFFVYAAGMPKRYFSITLDAEEYDEKTYRYIDAIPLEDLGMLAHFKGDRLNFSYTDEEGDTFTIVAHRYKGGPLPVYPEVAPRKYLNVLKAGENRKDETTAAADYETLAQVVADHVGDVLTKSAVEDVLNHYRMRPAFHAACVQWAQNPDLRNGDGEDRLAAFDNLVAAAAPEKISVKEKKEPAQEKTAAKTGPRNTSGDTPMHMVDDKNKEERQKIDQEAIRFHADTISIIRRNLERDRAELEKEKDPQRRKDLEMRILGDLANIQSEQDRMDSLKAGIVIHRRSPWDDYAKSQFIQNIARDQHRMEKVTKSMRKAYKMADSLPPNKAEQVRKQLQEGFSPEVLATGDTQSAGRVINEVYGIAAEYWTGEKKKADADAQWADTCLYTAQTVKSTADKSLMVLSMAGGSSVNRAYQGITGYIEGGPKEAFLRVGGSYNQLTGIAVDGYRGFEAAVESGGGWKEGFQGAGWEVVKGMVIDKAMQIGVGGVMKGYSSYKNYRAQADAPTLTGKARAADSAAAPDIAIKKKIRRKERRRV